MIDTLIIGGGAAGLYASSLLPRSVILERGSCGRKLLLTGGGRCNYTHNGDVTSLLPHYHGSLPFIRKVLYSHTPDDIISRFRKLGIEPEDENGKIFPQRGDAHDILHALTSHNPEIIESKAISIKKEDGSFQIKTDHGETLLAKKVLLAAGGSAYPQTGSDGSGFILASSLCHTVIPARPALAALALSPSLRKAEGITTGITLRKGKKSVSDTAVITARGISGPAAENFSYLLSGQEEITISFCQMDMKEMRASKGAMLLKNALKLPPRLSIAILGDTAEKKVASISAKEEREILGKLSAGRYLASPIAQSAMSTAGGVDTSEINAATMESRLVPGLFFAGDIINVDADCGGYSLTWAFATAYTASLALSAM